MKLKHIFYMILIFWGSSLLLTDAFAQKTNLYMPRDIQKAYKSGTRSYDGNPGLNYWQNQSNYKINVELIPPDRLIKGNATITYFNNSPDSLQRIVFRLYHDIYKKGARRDIPVHPGDLHNGVDIHRLIINGKEFQLDSDDPEFTRPGTNMIVNLSNTLSPNSSTIIEIEWSYTITNKTNIRTGAYDSTSFLVAYWYPQIAVYDDINGWDTYSYSGHQEFYNDHCNFDVEITVPKNFIVWGTGILQNPKDVLNKEYLNRYNSARESDQIINIITEKDLDSGEITKQKDKLTWKFKAEYVPDFTFATSDHYLWDKTSLIVDDQSGRRVTVDAAYKIESEDFYQVADIAKKSIDYFSKGLPGVPFPYPELTVFNGSGGMEFPMMVNDGSQETRDGTVGLTAHEISHTYFPFYMGTNERKYAWMDEGWARMLPFDFQSAMVENSDRRANIMVQYSFLVGKEFDMPTITPSILYSGHTYRPSYRGASYTKAAVAYQMLRDLVGDELFKKALHEYINRWHGKHPIPYDFFFSFNEALDEDLSWFWNPWFFDRGYPDLALGEVKENSDNTEVEIIRHGNIPIPASLKLIFEDDSEKSIEKSARTWKDGKKRINLKIDHQKVLKRIELGNKYIPDVNLENNMFETESKK